MQAIFVEGETKTGKGAASEAIAETLRQDGATVYYDVAGDFFRRYVAMVRRELGLGEAADMPDASVIIATATKIYEAGQAFALDASLGDLQRPAISRSVSLLGEQAIAQQAAAEWYGASVQQAIESGADILVLDGRNPRDHVERQAAARGLSVETILDVYMTCEPREAAHRLLALNGETNLESEMQTIADRRARDRTRAEHPFIEPAISLSCVPGKCDVAGLIAQSRQPHEGAAVPIPICVDNTNVTKKAMLETVAALTLAARI